MKQIEIGWLAGFIDGEGTISLSKTGPWRRPGIQASSTDLELLLEAQRLVGGSISPAKKSSTNKKPSWLWKLNGARQVQRVLHTVAPHLKCPLKNARALYILENYDAVTIKNGFYDGNSRKMKIDFELGFFALGARNPRLKQPHGE